MTVYELHEALCGMPEGSEVRISADPGRGPSRGVRQLALVYGAVTKVYLMPERTVRKAAGSGE